MATLAEKPVHSRKSSGSYDEKTADYADVAVLESDIQAVGADVEEAIEAAASMSREEVDEIIRDVVAVHGGDPNFPAKVMDMARRYLEDPASREELYGDIKVEAALVKINSPYAEVRAVVSNHDDPSIPASTFRAWTIGLIYVGAGAFLNQFFSIRQPGITVYSNVAQLLAYPAGKLFERVLPATQFTTFGHTWSLNPGPFNMKEHMAITLMANVGFSAPYTNYVIFVQYIDRFFGQKWAADFGYQILIGLSTNFIGYGLAGLTRRFLVYPVQAVWPANLATIALNKAFHAETNAPANGWKISRMRMFIYCFAGMFVYFWFPNYIFQALSYFNWMAWIAPDSVNVNAITGSFKGLGLNPVPTFDWNVLTVGLDPIISPAFSVFNYFFGTLLTLPVIAALWYNNVWNTGYLPINSNGVFSNTGKRYVVARVVDEHGLFNETSYKQYSPAYLAASNILIYGIFFAVYTSTLSHAIIHHRREIANGFKSLISRRSVTQEHQDVHTRLMSSYKEVPEWVYFSVLVVAVGLGAAGVGTYPTGTTPAVVLYGVFLAMIFCVPVGIIMAITNIPITLNVLAEFLGGLWFPGNALAMNFFKSYGYVTTAHTLNFAQDLKLAHYTHMAPWTTFSVQMVATFVSTFVCVGVLNFQMTGIPNVCDPEQKDKFTCPGINTFFTASVLWGTLGPKKMFGAGAIYSGLLYCFLIGAALPVIFFFLSKRFRVFESFHLPVFLSGGLIWAPYNLSNIWPAVPVALFMNVYVKRRFLPWWSKYAYVLTTAFSCAIALSAILTFFALQYSGIEIVWWGNEAPYENCDYLGCTRLKIPEKGFFGPAIGEF